MDSDLDKFKPRHGNIIDITISEDGLRKMCAICVEFKTRAELFTDKQGVIWDVCEDCAKREGMDNDSDDDDASGSI